jgi:hypothetical protein
VQSIEKNWDGVGENPSFAALKEKRRKVQLVSQEKEVITVERFRSILSLEEVVKRIRYKHCMSLVFFRRILRPRKQAGKNSLRKMQT